MNTNQPLEEREIVYQVIGCSMEVLNELGHGLREKTYERALCYEFELQQIDYSKQACFPVLYKGQKIDEYIPDLVVEERIIVDVKTVEHIGADEIGQIINYLRITKLNIGVLINFKHAKLEWKRVVLSDH